MRVLVLGVNGLIGNTMFRKLNEVGFETFGIMRRSKIEFAQFGFMQSDRIIDEIHIQDMFDIESLVQMIKPAVIINCVGITRRKKEISDCIQAIKINALYPHQLAKYCEDNGIRLIHLSTDCVFSGDSGLYTEESIPDGYDMYARTKALGEVRDNPNCLTLRSSFLGLEISDKTELLEWLLAQEGKTIRGFTQAIYSGVSTNFLSKVVIDIIRHQPSLWGLYQIASDSPISKYDLLLVAKKAFNLDVAIEPDDGYSSDKSLSGARLKSIMKYVVPSWEHMLQDLAHDHKHVMNEWGDKNK
jgi:dTDP-4-dehydrorhamnose reductase